MIKKYKIISAIIIISLAVLSSIYVIFNGVICDIFMDCTQQLQTYKGSIPIRDTWGPFCISAWFVAIVLKLPYMLLGGEQYILVSKAITALSTALCGTICSVLLYRNIKLSRWSLFLGTMLFYLFLPDYLYTFLCHYTIAYNMVYLSIAVLVAFLGDNKKIYIVLLAILSAIGILSMPQYLLMALFILVLLLVLPNNSLSKKNTLFLYCSTIGLIGVLVLSYLLANGVNLLDLQYMMTESAHQESLIIRFFKRLIIIVLIFFIVSIYYEFMRNIKKEDISFGFLVSSLSITGICATIITRNYVLGMRIGYGIIIVLGIWCMLYWRKEINNEKLMIFNAVGFVFAFIVGTFTNTGAMIMAMGFVFPIIGYLEFRDNDKALMISPYIIIVLVLLQRLILIDDTYYTTAFECKYKIESGFMKGQYVTLNTYDKYNYCKKIMDKYTEPSDVIAILNGFTYESGYALTKAQVGISDYDLFSIENNNYVKYWKLNEDKIPNKIFVFENADVEKYLSNSEYEIVSFIKNNYSAEIIDDNVIIFIRQ